MAKERGPLWVSYAWDDNDEGDFYYLVATLEQAGIPALYDKIALVPGHLLWQQLGHRISESNVGGWACLLTPAFLRSGACLEELEYAAQRAIREFDGFPLFGLLHNVSASDAPPPIRIRLCVDLANPDWTEEIRAGLEGRPPKRTPPDVDEIVAKLHHPYLGNADLHAIEFRPRFGELRNWAIGWPREGPQPQRFGTGGANGGATSGMHSDSFTDTPTEIDGAKAIAFGSGAPLTAGTAAYVVFPGCLPKFVAFGVADAPFRIPKLWRTYRVGEGQSVTADSE